MSRSCHEMASGGGSPSSQRKAVRHGDRHSKTSAAASAAAIAIGYCYRHLELERDLSAVLRRILIYTLERDLLWLDAQLAGLRCTDVHAENMCLAMTELDVMNAERTILEYDSANNKQGLAFAVS